jgi:predicted ATPase
LTLFPPFDLSYLGYLDQARLRSEEAVWRGRALAEIGQTARGSPNGGRLTRYIATGSVQFVAFILTMLADAEGKAKQRERALGHLLEAERLLAETDDRWFEAELHRVRGEMLRGGDDTGAERCFQQAIDIAQQQSAKLWELRAAIGLARLWSEQGKRDAARNLLEPIYGWFTEGFDTPVLKEAQALLTQLED